MADAIPLWLKIGYTVMAAVVAAIYWVRYGPQNYLWFSDIALFGLAPALWFESALAASVLAAAVLLPELLWNISFFGRLATGRRCTGLADYMFESERPRWLRAVSLFHIPLLLVLLWCVSRLGYRPDAFPLAVLLAWIVLPLSYLLTDPDRNINWVHGFGPERRLWNSPRQHLAMLMTGFPLLVFLPAHGILLLAFG